LSSKRTWNIKDDLFNYQTFYQEIIMRLAVREDPWVCDTLRWWNEYVMYSFCIEGSNCYCRRVFGNERGKMTKGDLVREEDKKWQQFAERQAGRKAASRAAEAIRQAIAGK
jgi:hypothetical protein